ADLQRDGKAAVHHGRRDRPRQRRLQPGPGACGGHHRHPTGVPAAFRRLPRRLAGRVRRRPPGSGRVPLHRGAAARHRADRHSASPDAVGVHPRHPVVAMAGRRRHRSRRCGIFSGTGEKARRVTARRMWGVGAVLTGAAVLIAALRWGGGVDGRAIAGLPDAGPITAWALPATRLILDATATLTVGSCATAAFLLPGDDRLLGPAAYRLLRRAGWLASGWAAAGLALLGLTLSDLLGQPLSQLTVHAVLSL